MALPSVDYAPRDPAADVLHRVAREHLQTFLAEAAYRRDGQGVPRFVEEELRTFLACGFLAGGFARFRCAGCQTERLVAFSCKGRGFCPSRGPRRTDCVRWGGSCGGRRMTERAALLVDDDARDVCAHGVARRILTHLALPADVPTPALARAPPIGDADADD